LWFAWRIVNAGGRFWGALPHCSIARQNPPAICQRRSRSVVASPALHRSDDRRKHLPQQRGGSMIPDGYQSLTPYRTVADSAGEVTFYEKALGAKLRLKLERPDGKLGHTEPEIGDGIIRLADQCPGYEAYAPTRFGGSPITLLFYVEDVDAMGDRAVRVGTKLKRRVENMVCGERAGSFIDPFGDVWHVAVQIEEVPPGEINRRAAAAMSEGTGP